MLIITKLMMNDDVIGGCGIHLKQTRPFPTGIAPFSMSLTRISRLSRFCTPLIRCLSSLDGAAQVSVTESGKNLLLRRPGSKEKSFHSLWLRHSCQCSECTYSSGQRTVHWSQLPKDLKIKSATLLG